ncbi:hypothetical protein [Croceivirga thetidis]|uniref:Uncharacterized protein n=1 Tax=Croceivirga thetidis TaxID=2721623 RepID=A0ABX1GNG8_9FLAO|nr:hypothetical protein [Croceivirga thetidis]NKI31434.1 hypothetical protein [Croceivirga thetidis]
MFKNQSHRLFVLFLLTIIGCQEVPTISKHAETDFFKGSMVESQYFKISGEKDQVIEGLNGTILVLPKGCFLNSFGIEVDGEITIELAEALRLEDMILSNLTTMSNGQLLETGGMIYLNATSREKQLVINPEKPIYIEVPTAEIKPDMMVYKGVRNEKGNMNWVEPKAIPNYLIPFDLEVLDFLPNGFQEEVEQGLPFGKFKTPSKTVVDSLYYFQEAYFKNTLQKLYDISDLPNEPQYDFTLEGEQVNSLSLLNNGGSSNASEEVDTLVYSNHGVNPSKIKAIRNKIFENTLIATREFEQRLQIIYKVCRPDILDLYTNNLDKNMWEIDSLVVEVLAGDRYQDAFLSFKEERKTKVRGSSKNGKLLSNYYRKQVQKAENEKERLLKQLTRKHDREQKSLVKIKRRYQEILIKRERYRMLSYGFTQTDMGWVNIDKGTGEKEWEEQNLTVKVQNGQQYDQLFTYVFYKSIRSLYRLSSQDMQTFYVGNANSQSMPIPKHKPAIAVSVGYEGETRFLGTTTFETTAQKEISLDLKKVSKNELQDALADFENNGKENSIRIDLEFATRLQTTKKEKQTLERAYNFLNRLKRRSFPSDSSFLRFDVEYQIDLQVDTCLSGSWVREVVFPEEVPEEKN